MLYFLGGGLIALGLSRLAISAELFPELESVVGTSLRVSGEFAGGFCVLPEEPGDCRFMMWSERGSRGERGMFADVLEGSIRRGGFCDTELLFREVLSDAWFPEDDNLGASLGQHLRAKSCAV